MNRSDGKNVISFHPIFSAIGEDTKQREESSITASPGCSLAKLFLSRNCEKGEARRKVGRTANDEGGRHALTKQHERTDGRTKTEATCGINNSSRRSAAHIYLGGEHNNNKRPQRNGGGRHAHPHAHSVRSTFEGHTHTVGFARENETKMVISNSELKKRVLHVGKRKVIKRRRV